jgi:hypothetical protein
MSLPGSQRPRTGRRPAGVPTQRPRGRRGKRQRPAASAVPLRCFVLAVDTAGRSGWAALAAGSDDYLGWGEVDTLDREAVAYIVRWAGAHADARGLPLVLVLEAPFGGNIAMLIGLGAARERWLSAAREYGLPQRRCVFVQPSEWRSPVLGRRWARAPREEVRPHEQLIASAIVGEPVRGDEAAAILIAKWGLRAAKVAAALERGR